MRLVVLAVTLAGIGCGRDLDRSIAVVTAPRVLAVRADPPESPPGALVDYTAVAATPSGGDAQAAIAWAFCLESANLTEASPVSGACITGQGTTLASGAAVSLATPADACRRFGPQGLPAQPGMTAPRPAAPDVTGGYYQPLLLAWQDGVTAAFERLTCDPTGVSLDLSQLYRNTRVANQNPQLLPLLADVAGAAIDAIGANGPAVVVAGTALHVVAAWPPESSERYVTIDIANQALVWHTENLWVAWFATAGALDHDVSAPAADAQGTADNVWHLPLATGTYFLWIILHDDRGGVDFAMTAVSVP